MYGNSLLFHLPCTSVPTYAQVGDYVVRVNAECTRNVTNSQVRAILKRANLVGATCRFVHFFNGWCSDIVK